MGGSEYKLTTNSTDCQCLMEAFNMNNA